VPSLRDFADSARMRVVPLFSQESEQS
jgi:hypothetical protein